MKEASIDCKFGDIDCMLHRLYTAVLHSIPNEQKLKNHPVTTRNAWQKDTIHNRFIGLIRKLKMSVFIQRTYENVKTRKRQLQIALDQICVGQCWHKTTN